MTRLMGLREDEVAQGFLLFAPIVIGVILIVVGVLLVTSGSVGTGLIVAGVGALILGAGGSATLGFGALKVTGPVGFILIVFGTIVTVFWHM